MPGTLSFYFFLLTLIPIWNGQTAAGCHYDLRAAQMACPAPVVPRTTSRRN